ncbi:hypothetical protein [Sulfurisphaera tokodaii]|uniref:Uncharacterized protein n=2 Tax=Sulfurisphaera tokodaii TaxID=111955 RepID=Q970J4_SULTO|nr:hypothetical protein [Sulfurisphaera tokodaii]BAB66679.1 hypothetical protein STK_16010 [Sulfurisphaera tokodaii str. 7]HII73500.1 hypothetical protein [Sulfurisphaera tokodaii]
MNSWKTISVILIAVALILGGVTAYNIYDVYFVNHNSNNPLYVFTSVSTPTYKQDPVIGNYSFIIGSGTTFTNLGNKTLVASYVYINLTKIKIGDSFLVFAPVNNGSEITRIFYLKPIVNITILNDSVYISKGYKYLNLLIKVIYPAFVNDVEYDSATIILNYSIEVTSMIHIIDYTWLYVEFLALNSTVLKMEFYVGPTTF